MTHRIKTVCYQRILYHAYKYSASDVMGLLLSDGNSITNILPIAHVWLGKMQLELAVELSAQYLKESSLKIIGLYVVENKIELKEKECLGPNADSWFQFLLARFSDIDNWVVVKLDNSKLQDIVHVDAIKLFQYSKDKKAFINKNWSLEEGESEKKEEEALKEINDNINERKFMDLIDLDDHLFDPSLRWLDL